MGTNEDTTVVILDEERRKRAAAGRSLTGLSLHEKVAALRGLPGKRQMDLILADPKAKELTRSLPEHDFYWLLADIGINDASELWEFASPEQRTFILDLELWDRWNFSSAKAYEWLCHLLEAGEEAVTEQIPYLDLELLLLMLAEEIAVGGGVGELASDDERTADWDHSFDNVYFITFRNPKHGRAVGTLLDIIFRNDHELYQGLMEGVRGEVGSELEELAFQFRSARLADLGFPELEEAQSLYARLDPATFTLADDKKMSAPTAASPPALTGHADSLLNRAMSRAWSDIIDQELSYLINSALVADGAALHDREAMQRILERVHGYVNIALEHLAGTDEEKASSILAGEHLKRLFQLGFGIVIGLRRRAEGLTSDDHTTDKALEGLRLSPPRCYRAFDPDHADGFREFREMADVRQIEEFLQRL
ncbi:MAG: hypothetical protein ED859_04435 [Desulfuromonadales bacterium]|nr:MAG: hypothetical protein ED859_04435 [Desulfuromonadales bacterium]